MRHSDQWYIGDQLVQYGRYMISHEEADKTEDVVTLFLYFQVPYNFERIIYMLSGGDCELVRQTMSQYETEGKSSIPSNILNKVS